MSSDQWRGWVRQWLPPEAVRIARAWLKQGVGFRGDFDSWEEACAMASGYEDEEIIMGIQAAALRVKRGEALFERDGVLFYEEMHRYPLLSGLMRAAATKRGALDVLDFGGGLGGTYFQCRPFLTRLDFVRWRIVELPVFVDFGRKSLEDEILTFHESIDEAGYTDNCVPNVVLFSSVLQYMAAPLTVLQKIAELGADHVIIDRTPVVKKNKDAIALQTVSQGFGRQHLYPVNLLRQESLLAPLMFRYKLLAQFDAIDAISGGLRRRVEFKGFILEKKIE